MVCLVFPSRALFETGLGCYHEKKKKKSPFAFSGIRYDLHVCWRGEVLIHPFYGDVLSWTGWIVKLTFLPMYLVPSSGRFHFCGSSSLQHTSSILTQYFPAESLQTDRVNKQCTDPGYLAKIFDPRS